MNKPDRHHLNQMIKDNTPVTTSCYRALRRAQYHFNGILVRNEYLEFSHKKISDKPKLKDIDKITG